MEDYPRTQSDFEDRFSVAGSIEAKIDMIQREIEFLRTVYWLATVAAKGGKKLVGKKGKDKKPVDEIDKKVRKSLGKAIKDTLDKAAKNAKLKKVIDKIKTKGKKDEFSRSGKNGQEKQRQEAEKRKNDILKGFYPKDMTKEELIASLGEPDRIYKGQVYEQLVYFDRSPRRFWFKDGHFF